MNNCVFDIFINFLKNITKITLVYEILYIILDQFEIINEKIQQILKVIIEKSIHCKFIIITNKYNILTPSIKNKGFCIRIYEPSSIDKYIYLKKNLIRENIVFDEDELLTQCKQKQINFLILYYFQGNFQNIEEKYYLQIKNIIEKEKLSFNDIKNIRKISIHIKQLNLSIQNILLMIMDDFYNTNNFNILNICAEFEYNNIFSYRELIHIEKLILEINMYNNHIKIK